MNKKKLRQVVFFSAVLLILFSTCRVYAELPDIFPVDVFFARGNRGGAQISPDGKFLSYLSPSEKQINNVWISTVGKKDDRMITQETKYGIYTYYWAYDNKHIVYMMDDAGDENFHVFATNIETGKTRDLAKFAGAKAQNIQMSKNVPHEILVGLNVRDKRHHDMYRIDLKTGKVELDTENPGDVRWWLADHNLVVRAAVALDHKDISTTLRVRDGKDKPWRDLIVWPFGETGLLEGYGSEIAVAFTKDGKGIFVQAAFSGNQTQLARVDVKTGKIIEIVASHPKAGVWNIMTQTLYDRAQVLFHPETGEVQAVGFEYLIPEWKVYDPEIKKDFQALKKVREGAFYIESRDIKSKTWIVSYYSDRTTGAFYIYDRTAKKAELLFETAPQLKKYTFAEMKPVIIKARDGMDIPCYLTLPVGIPAKNLPMVLSIHGGPWARDQWGFNGMAQLLANRGYAVLQVNFRGSAGFGKKFLNAGNGQWGVGSMQHDITDAAKWFVKNGIADAKRIGIVGGSYGGYAVLAGLAFTPDLYTCGIAMSGPSNVKTNVEAMPEWWYLIKQRWLRRMGNVLKDDALNRRISPFYHADKIKAKLLIFHGKNDPRVKIEESDQIVATMRKNKKEVVYVVYPDEGHGIARPANLIDMIGRLETFLAKHLGGRSLPFKKIPGTSAELR